MRNTTLRHRLLWLPLLLWATGVRAQDPRFSQFFSSPLTLSPALTGQFEGEWRAMANFRQQWWASGYPYSTTTLDLDGKLLPRYLPEGHQLSGGLMLMYDQSLQGGFKGNFAAGSLAYHVALDGEQKHKVGLGLGASYGRRIVDYTKLTFAEQFTSGGFNTNLPTGEQALSNMTATLSTNAGITYAYQTEKFGFDLGGSAFHLNKPKQTLLQDPMQELPTRWNAHGGVNWLASPRSRVQLNAMHMRQQGATETTFGGALGHDISAEEGLTVVYAGLWYRWNDAFFPYFGLFYRGLHLGFSYDVTVSKLRNAPYRANSFEISVIYRHKKSWEKGIPCPWR